MVLDSWIPPHRLVYEAPPLSTEALAQQYISDPTTEVHTSDGNAINPVIRYTVRNTVNQAGTPVTLPLAVKAFITYDTVALRDRTSSDIPSSARKNITNMTINRSQKYDVGHLIAYQNNGPNEVYNFAPQTPALNRGPWLQMEEYINKWARFGGSIDMLVVVKYQGTDTVPYEFAAKATLHNQDGSVHSELKDTVFRNI